MNASAPRPEYAIVVPAWNEEAILGQTVGQLRTIAENLGRPHELVVVDDEEGRAVFGCELLEAGLGDHGTLELSRPR